MVDRSLHNINMNRDVLKYFGFRADHDGISEQAVQRIFEYSSRIFSTEFFTNDMWVDISRYHATLIEICKNRNSVKFLELMKLVATTPLVIGFMNYAHYTQLVENESLRLAEAEQFIDKLLSLAEYLGAVRVLNPEQGGFEVNDNFEQTLALVNPCFANGHTLITPPAAAGGAFGLMTDRGIWCLKDLLSRYTARRVAELMKRNTYDHIVEIGAGLGILPYYVSKENNHNITYYSYDLPTVSIIQAYFLMRSLGEHCVTLEGEPGGGNGTIHLRPFWLLATHDESKNALWINQDSMPEIDASVLSTYFDKISRIAGGHFLSINQEAMAGNGRGGTQSRVPDFTSRYSSLSRVYRCRDFLRLGWIEELYEIRGAAK